MADLTAVIPSLEFDYVDGAEEVLAHARDQGWSIVSMKGDWSTVFPDA